METGTLKSHAIEVAQFRQILIWPLALRLALNADQGAIKSRIAEMNRLLRDARGPVPPESTGAANAGPRLWHEIDDLLDHCSPVSGSTVAQQQSERDKTNECAQSYAEFVYFYDFLQSTLFRGHNPDPPFTLWRREGIKQLRLTLKYNAGGKRERCVRLRADVVRFNLYVFATGAIVVAVEIVFDPKRAVCDDNPAFGGSGRPMTLEDCLTVTDHLRRAYTPYFYVDDKAKALPSRVPVSFQWLDQDGHPIAFADPDNPGTTRDQFGPGTLEGDTKFIRTAGPDGHRTAPVFGHWRAALAPLVFDGYASPDSTAPVWRHVLDERIPVMTFLSLTGAAKKCNLGPSAIYDPNNASRADVLSVSKGDWIRLCFADEAGNDPMPYNPRFMANFHAEHCYDRYFPHAETDQATRYLFAGYHFAAVGAGGFMDKAILHHFRRHYFQMVLLANLELASLLITSSRITHAIEDLHQPGKRAKFAKTLEHIQGDFLQFVHRFRFTGVSNQIQASELFDRLRKSMKLEALFTDVKDELEAAIAYTNRLAQSDISSSSQQLTMVATVAATIGLAFAFVAIGFIADPIKDLIKDHLLAMPPIAGVPNAIDWTKVGIVAAGMACALLTAGLFALIGNLMLSKFREHGQHTSMDSAAKPSSFAAFFSGRMSTVATSLFVTGMILFIGGLCLTIK